VAQMMMPLSNASGGRGNTRSDSSSRSRTVGSRNWRKMKPVKLPETRWITKPTTRTNQGPGATIMDKTSIRIKNDMTTMISNLAGRKELQVKLRHIRNRWHMKLESAKSVMTNNKKRTTISGLNRHGRRKQTHRIKMRRVMWHVKGGSEIKDPRWLSARLWELRRVSRRDHGWIGKRQNGALDDPSEW
jgi:hypothetical protein